ncbi:MAG: N-6 DNA methylase [Gammaproteobacteria bacterium]|nr:N-6 DNA methylase [Gammaproteobacteria bacterium]
MKKPDKKQKSFEQSLWDTADKLRGTVESSEYKHVVLSLIFLKFISDKFEDRRRALIDEGQQDYVDMANPPFNLKAWRAADELGDDPRWAGYEVPPIGNANYGWIMHMISKLSEHGVAGFVLANGSMSTSTSGEGAIRQKIIENDLVDCMIALPGQLFYTTQIPVCLWFLSKSKKADAKRDYRDRQNETLFIDARNIGAMIDRTHKEFSADDIAGIARTYHAWRGEAKDGAYEDKAGYCKSATLGEIKANDYVLTPGRYVGAAEIEDDGVPFEEKMGELSRTLYRQMEESKKIDEVVKGNLRELGYGI